MKIVSEISIPIIFVNLQLRIWLENLSQKLPAKLKALCLKYWSLRLVDLI